MKKKTIIKTKKGQNLHNELRGMCKKKILMGIYNECLAGYVVGSYAAMKLTS